MRKIAIISRVAIVLIAGLLTGCSQSNASKTVAGKVIEITFNDQLHSRVAANLPTGRVEFGEFAPSEYLIIAGNSLTDFKYANKQVQQLSDKIGSGQQVVFTGTAENLQKNVAISLYDDFPGMAVYQVTYTNTGTADIVIDGWVNNRYQLQNATQNVGEAPFWSYQSGSYESRDDWVKPLSPGFEQKNYMGMNASDYGGGTPVSDVWSRSGGLAVGHVELAPKLVSLPVSMSDEHAEIRVSQEKSVTLKPGETFETLRTFVAAHSSDYFEALANYREFMIRSGIEFRETPASSYDPVWCAWGYERDFTMPQIYGTLPKVKELGFKWAVLDDGWQTAEGDWYLLKSKFPRGDRDMLAFTETIRQNGLRPKLWWAPLAVDPGTDLIKNHEDYLLKNADGSYQDITWWNSYYLCPAYPPVLEYTRKLVDKIIDTWGYDGLKIDGQHLNGVPPCYNPAHNHPYPEIAVEKLPEFFEMIFETALAHKSDAVVEICPCGTAYSFFNLPFMNQAVSSDPLSSWQIRLKGKTLKALMGPSAPYYGDHVELSDSLSDFASTVGIGGIVGTKFTWPVGAKKDSDIDLTAEKEKIWAKWVSVYNEKMLPTGIYRGELYDIGYDRPETHAIAKNGSMFYAFYAENFDGTVELRGLEKGRNYTVTDYVNGTQLSTVSGENHMLPVAFKQFLLIEVSPENAD
ncbi:MAG: alpha-galactosidase [Calditrichaeota bacterium]|nr:alpha-galactosidase [Calditrichota bacterium]